VALRWRDLTVTGRSRGAQQCASECGVSGGYKRCRGLLRPSPSLLTLRYAHVVTKGGQERDQRNLEWCPPTSVGSAQYVPGHVVSVQAEPVKIVNGLPFKQCADLLRAQPPWEQIIDQHI